MGILNDRYALITGVISDRSIAYGIAKALHREGAKLAFTYQNERFLSRVTDMAAEFDSKLVFPCDVSNDEEIKTVFTELNKTWSGLDILVHSLAFAPADQLEGDY